MVILIRDLMNKPTTKSYPKGYKATTVRAYDVISNVYKKENYEPDFWRDEFKILLGLMRGNAIKIKGSKFLDLGCGTGRDAELAINSGMQYVGIDLSKGMLNLARKMVKEASFYEMDVTRLEFGDNEFDVVWASAVLLHLNELDLEKALEEIKRVLKSGHFAFISMERRQKIKEAKMMKKSVKDGRLIERFFALYTRSEFKRILKRAGFTVVKVTSKVEPEGEKEWLSFFMRNASVRRCHG